jgi:shikimate kinase
MSEQGLFLIGPPGAGKTTLLPMLSKEINKSPLDTDEWIKTTHQKSIFELYQDKGEEFLTKEEERCLHLHDLRSLVVSSSGSVIFTRDREYVKSHSLVFWLDVSPNETVSFLKQDKSLDRIVIGQENLLKNLEKRQKLYADWADHKISREGKTVQDIAKEVLAIWES